MVESLPRGLGPGVFAISLAGIAFEILLLRIFALRWSHHFAHLVIGAGLLGFGLSGTLMALVRDRLRSAPGRWLTTFALAFAVAIGALLPLTAQVSFTPERLLIDLQLGALLVELVAVLLPFLCAGLYVGLALVVAGQRAPSIYAASLVGSAVGAPLAVLALHFIEPEPLVAVLGAAGVFAAAVLRPIGATRSRWPALGAGALAWGALLVAALTSPGTPPSEYKDLARVLGFPDARRIERRSGPLGRLEVVASDSIVYSPGRSLNAVSDPLPRQRALFLDGDQLGVVTQLDGDPRELGVLGELLSSLPYELRRGRRCLVVGAGGGFELLQARHADMDVIGLEMNPDVVAVMTGSCADFSGDLYRRPGVRIVVGEARRTLRSLELRTDLIVLPCGAASSVSGFSVGESSLHTVEAFREFLEHLEDDGILAASAWLRTPARDGLRLIATALAALEELGVADAGAHLLVARDWAQLIVLCRRTPWTEELWRASAWLEQRGFDRVFHRGMPLADANRHHQLPEASYALGTRWLLDADREEFLAAYPFDVRPVTDDRPFFGHTLKRGSLEVLERELGGAIIPLGDWSEVLLVWSALQAVLLAALFLVAPLATVGVASWLRRGVGAPAQPWRSYLYFAAIGGGYLTVEISLIQRLTQFLADPIFAATVVLAVLLLASGLGSRVVGRRRGSQGARQILVAIVALGLLQALYLPLLLEPFRGSAAVVRWGIAVLACAPLGFLMGFPFPVALRQLQGESPDAVPWAWGCNGFASVVAATAAALLALRLGYTAVALAGVIAYAAAAGLGNRSVLGGRG